MQGFIQDFILGKVRGKCVGGGHRRGWWIEGRLAIFKVTNRRIR